MLEQLLQIGLVVPMDDPTKPGCRMGVPMLLWGDPGIGKSSRVKRLGLRMNLYVGVLFPSGRLPEDFAGVPVMDGNGGLKLVSALLEIAKLNETKEGILMIDEINTARSAVQAAMHGVVLDRRSGDIIFAPKVRIMAAANPVESSTGGHAIEPALANRFLHLDLSHPSAEEWSNFMMGFSQDDNITAVEELEAIVAENWAESFAKARGQFCGFIRAASSHLMALPAEGSPERSKAYPTPRTLELAIRVSATCQALNVTGSIETKLVRGCIGEGATDAFVDYRAKADLPDPTDVLKNGFDPDKRRLDRSYAVYGSLASYVASMPKGEQQLKAALRTWQLLEQGASAGLSDLIYEPAVLLVNKNLGSTGGQDLGAASEPVLKRYTARMQASAKNITNYAKRKNAQQP